MLKNRLARLEQSSKQNQDGQKLCLVYRNEEKDRMTIPNLNFFGTIENAHTLMEQYPDFIFVIWSVMMDKDYSDEEWNQMVKDIAN